MKRIVILLVFLQCCMAGWSQTMTIKYKNGSTKNYNMNDIEEISFPQEGNSESGSGSSSIFTMTRDGKVYESQDVEDINPIYGHGGHGEGNHFSMDECLPRMGQIHIQFPLSQYGENVPPSYFYVGYNDFGSYATDIVYISSEMAGWHGEYVSGSAVVTKNDGKYITVQFNNYKFSVSRSGSSHEYVLNGTLPFLCYMYD